MAKLNIYLITLIVLIALFHLGGLIQNTGTSYIFQHMGLTEPQNFNSSIFFTQLSAITAITVVAVVAGLILAKNADIALLPTILAIGTVMFTITWDLIAIYNAVALSNRSFALIMMFPLLVVYVLTIVEWIRGMNT